MHHDILLSYKYDLRSIHLRDVRRKAITIRRERGAANQKILLNCRASCNSPKGHPSMNRCHWSLCGWQSGKECQDAHVTQFSFNYLRKGTDDIFVTASLSILWTTCVKGFHLKKRLVNLNSFYVIMDLVEKHSFENVLPSIPHRSRAFLGWKLRFR